MIVSAAGPRRAATRFGGRLSSLQEHSFDLIVLNSIIQYFPSVEYLMTALDEALRVARPGGRLFIGDVRHTGLLNALHASVQLYRADGDMSIAG